MKTLVCFLWLTVVAFGQTHVPSYTIDGASVTFDAEYVSLPPGTVPQSALGINLGSPSQIAEFSRGQGITVVLDAGTYDVFIMGRPDDPMQPERQVIDATIVIVGPTRMDSIRDAYFRFFFGRDEKNQASSDLEALAPTEDEQREALLGP